MDFVARDLLTRSRPIVLDVRGRGLSEFPGRRITWTNYAADTARGDHGPQAGPGPLLLGASMARPDRGGSRPVSGQSELRGTVLVDRR